MPTSDWTPTVDDVGSLIRGRTIGKDGRELGTFTGDTRPTAVQVQLLFPKALAQVSAALGTEELASTLWDAASEATALRTALKIELSYFPEQVANGRSSYPQLKTLYDEAIDALRKALEAGGTTVPDGDLVPAPDYAFPTHTIVGWKGGPW